MIDFVERFPPEATLVNNTIHVHIYAHKLVYVRVSMVKVDVDIKQRKPLLAIIVYVVISLTLRQQHKPTHRKLYIHPVMHAIIV